MSKPPLDLSLYLDPQPNEKLLSLPLQFEYLPVDIISKEYTKLNSNHPYRIHYLGPRFANTLALHRKYSAASCTAGTAKHKHWFEESLGYSRYQMPVKKIIQSTYLNQRLQNNHYYKSSLFYRAFEGMNPTLNPNQELIFDSCFQSGNLDCVVKVSQTEYDLFLRIDSNTRGHTQWFYFSVGNGTKCGRVTFNICNLTKSRTLYEQGMRPYVFSKVKHQRSGRGWQQQGENVELTEKMLRYGIVYEMIDCGPLFRLSFDYTFTEADDEVFFAYSIPYSYSQLLGDIDRLPKDIVRKGTLGRSLTGVEIPIIHIGDHSISSKAKKNVLIIGRAHPGESNGSHVLQGLIQYLCSPRQQATRLRAAVNFIIVPMSNPDGVILGNSRSSASGKDLNREYLTTKKQLYPQVSYIKSLAYKLQKSEGLFMFFDFHGHSRKKNTFFYGPAYSVSQPEYYKSRAFAKLVEKLNHNFRYYGCSFMLSEEKKKTARGVLFQHYKIPYVYTIESSIGLYYDTVKMRTSEYTRQEWQKMGADLCQATGQFLAAHDEYEEMLADRRRCRERRKEKLWRRNGRDRKNQAEANDQSQNIEAKKAGLLFEMIEEIRQGGSVGLGKSNEQESDSDDHDEDEDLEMSKLREFNNLVIQTKQKNLLGEGGKIHEVGQDQGEDPIVRKAPEGESEQLQIMRQLAEEKKNKVRTQVTTAVKARQQKQPGNASETRRSSSLYQRTMAIKSIPVRESWRQQRKNASNSAETHTHLVSKQFFPTDKCEIVDLPKTSLGMRKEIKKGRVLIDEYLRDRKSEQQSSPSNPRRLNSSSRNLSLPSQKLMPRPAPKLRVDSVANYRTLSHKKLGEGRCGENRPSLLGPSRIFDPALFSGFRAMEIDNMAMMIRTFNR